MASTLTEIVRQRLAETNSLAESWAPLVVAACEGGDALDRVLSGDPASAGSASATVERPPGGAFLRSIRVQGFRGIGERRELQIRPGPGLTLVLGRNGSGKSSFAEALELLFTGDNLRWSSKSKVWKDGWKNLHFAGQTEIGAELDIEGVGAVTTVERKWPIDAELPDAEATVQHRGQPRAHLKSLNWTRALDLYRPFLSYTELGTMFDEGPTSMYDHLSAMLGLEDLVSGQKALAAHRLNRKKLADQVRVRAKELVDQLEGIADDRARRCAAELGAKKWDLDAIASFVSQPAGEDDGRLTLLRQVIALEAPTDQQIDALAEKLTEVAQNIAEANAAPAGEANELANLLNAAVAYWKGHPESMCPVCGVGSLDDSWAARSAASIDRLRLASKTALDVQDKARQIVDEARAVAVPTPRALRDLGPTLDGSEVAASAWSEFAAVDWSDLQLAATHLRVKAVALRAAFDVCVKEARLEIAKREQDWLIIAAPVWTWLSDATESARAESSVRDLQAAESWLKDTAGAIRLDRFAPIAAEAMALWKTLGQGHLDLEQVGLEGSGPARHPVLRVDLDGVESDALSVMSQGELHSVALSLFLPRATLAESPFRFLVIDDPVQSMDPARVDGLARVLDGVARNRQVIVFTHDDRLPEAIRRLGMDAVVHSVTRGERSALLIRLEREPVLRALSDARALARTAELPAALAARLVPGYCRVAIEAACVEVVRRRRLGKGEPHAEVDALVRGRNLTPLLSLALFDDGNRGGEVADRMNRDFGPKSTDAYLACNKGSHAGHGGVLKT